MALPHRRTYHILQQANVDMPEFKQSVEEAFLARGADFLKKYTSLQEDEKKREQEAEADAFERGITERETVAEERRAGAAERRARASEIKAMQSGTTSGTTPSGVKTKLGQLEAFIQGDHSLRMGTYGSRKISDIDWRNPDEAKRALTMLYSKFGNPDQIARDYPELRGRANNLKELIKKKATAGAKGAKAAKILEENGYEATTENILTFLKNNKGL